MESENNEKSEAEKKKSLLKFERTKAIINKFAKAITANTILRSGGYDHSEGPDFDKIHEAIDRQYQKSNKEISESEEKADKDDPAIA